jgi:hypothetical protein
MKTVKCTIRFGKPEWNIHEQDYISPAYIYSPLLKHGDCDGKIPVCGVGTKYAAKIFLHGAPQPAQGKQTIELSDTIDSPRSDIGYNSYGSFLKIIIVE